MFVARQKIIFSEHEPKIFRITTYILSFILVEAYSTPNLLNFYILFEASLIPTLILILSWGLQPERLQHHRSTIVPRLVPRSWRKGAVSDGLF